MKVLVCGGRDFDDWVKFIHTLDVYYNEFFKGLEIISGMARGADSLAVKYAKGRGLVLHEFPAEWDTYGKAAGSIRNQQMLDEGKPDLVIAFPTEKSRGTYDMIRRSEKAGVPVKIIEAK